jgi:hypothetical protein
MILITAELILQLRVQPLSPADGALDALPQRDGWTASGRPIELSYASNITRFDLSDDIPQ